MGWSREQLREQLVQSRIAGEVATPRENNLRNYRRMSQRDPLYLLGLEPVGSWRPDEVLALMVRRCGVIPHPGYTSGQDTIDPDRTLDRLDAMADRLREAADRRERVLVATGHPVALRPVHAAVASGLAAAGCPLVEAADGWPHPADPAYEHQVGTVRYLSAKSVASASARDAGLRSGPGQGARVAVLTHPDGALAHTHSPLPMRAVLAELAARGEPAPDLVVADHGWAGAAGQAGIDAVGFADCNDPALFVGEAEGRVRVTVPLDDNLAPDLYAPLTAYLLDRAGLS